MEKQWRRREKRDDFAKTLEKVVEAVGVEPTSERPVAAELYMLIRPWYFAIGNKERRMRRPLAQMSLVHDDAGRVSGPAD